MQVRFTVHGDQSELTDVLLEGNAELRETKTAKPDEKPLWPPAIGCNWPAATARDSQVTVAGKPAYVEARGMSLSGANIQLERSSNRLWVDGAGRMTMPIAGDLHGAVRVPAAGQAQQKLEINWDGRMNFDGRTALFEQAIVAHTSQQLLRTEKLEVTLKRTIDFANPPGAERKSEPAQIDQIVCQGGASGKSHVRRRGSGVDRSDADAGSGHQRYDRRHRRARAGLGFQRAARRALAGRLPQDRRAAAKPRPPIRTKEVRQARQAARI